MQNKVDKLTDIVKNIKSVSQRNYALTLLSELVDIINKQESEIKSLMAWKTNNKISEIDCELEKYVLLLIYYGYSQRQINNTRIEAVKFLATNKDSISIKSSEDIKTLDHWLMNFELEKQRMPKSYQEFKQFVTDAKS